MKPMIALAPAEPPAEPRNEYTIGGGRNGITQDPIKYWIKIIIIYGGENKIKIITFQFNFWFWRIVKWNPNILHIVTFPQFLNNNNNISPSKYWNTNTIHHNIMETSPLNNLTPPPCTIHCNWYAVGIEGKHPEWSENAGISTSIHQSSCSCTLWPVPFITI